jgi:hypothetical protein
MSEEILEKLIEHDVNFVQINQRFDEHDAKFLEHDRRFDEIDCRFDRVDEQIDLLAQKSIEHDGLFERLINTAQKHEERLDRIEANMATKSDIGKIMHTLNYLVKIVEKNSQEITANNHGLFRLTDRVEILEKHCGIT